MRLLELCWLSLCLSSELVFVVTVVLVVADKASYVLYVWFHCAFSCSRQSMIDAGT
jgi:hypothetical protein